MFHHIDGKRNLEASNDWLISLLDRGVSLVSGLGPEFEHEAEELCRLEKVAGALEAMKGSLER